MTEEQFRKHMSITLPQQMQRWIEWQVEKGHYHSYSEVVREALRLLIAKDNRRRGVRK